MSLHTRPVNSASGNVRPSTRPVLTGNGNRSPSTWAVNSGRQLGYWKPGLTVRVVLHVCIATRGVHSVVFEALIADPERSYKKIFDLKDDTEYEITIWALTASGRGEPKVIVEVTVPSSGTQ